MRKTMGKLLVAVALSLGMMVCLAPQAKAQSKRINIFGGYSFGTNSLYQSEGPATAVSLNDGYGFGVAFNLNNHIGLEANFTGHKGTPTLYIQPVTSNNNGYLDTVNENLYTYTFGPRLFQNFGNFTVFTHFLVGGAHFTTTEKQTCLPSPSGSCGSPNPSVYTSSGSGFAFKTGGGVDWSHGIFGIRILEVDYLHAQMLSAFTPVSYPNESPWSMPQSGSGFELTTGITINFGKSL